MKKFSILFTLFTLLTISSAHAVVCSFTENEGTRAQIITEIPLESENDHGMTHFDLSSISGFIAASNGYLVVNVVLKDNKQVFSLNTLINDNTLLGGSILTPSSRLIRIGCK